MSDATLSLLLNVGLLVRLGALVVLLGGQFVAPDALRWPLAIGAAVLLVLGMVADAVLRREQTRRWNEQFEQRFERTQGMLDDLKRRQRRNR